MKSPAKKNQNVTEPMLVKVANSMTDAAVNGICTKGFLAHFGDGFVSSHALSAQYLGNDKYSNDDERIDDLIKWESLKSGAVGFLTGLGGFLTLPITLPADMAAVWAVQARMVGAIAEINGYSLKDESVKTGVLLCLIGSDVASAVRNSGVKLTTKITQSLINKIPGKVLSEINKKVGFRLLTKAGEKGIVNLTKLVPVFGGVFSGTFDTLSTKVVGGFARKFFTPKTKGRKSPGKVVCEP